MTKKVAILGYGVEGESAYKYFASQGADITIFDESPTPKMQLPPGAKLISGPGVFEKAEGFDQVVRGPAIRPDRIKANGPVGTIVGEFFAKCPAPIIGVTGSKGKGTTSSLIYNMLKNAGQSVHLAGNIGTPVLDVLPQVKPTDTVVLELSSFQLWDLKQSPHVAVVLMMEPEHLDVHKDVAEYSMAKSNIARWQKPEDVTVYLKGNELSEKTALVGDGQKIPYTRTPGAHVEVDVIVIDGQTICRTDELAIPGQHNIDNACAAITAAWQFTKDTAAIAKALREFKGLDHRLKLVSEVGGVRYYDDSIATTPGSAIAALASFSQPKVLILGGSDKGADFSELAQSVVNENMRAVILIGVMRHRLADTLSKAGYIGQMQQFDEHGSMRQIVKKAAELAQLGDVVLLSPACASFDMFKSYADRGDQFIAAVNELKGDGSN